MTALISRTRTIFAQYSPSVWRILLHSMLAGLSGSIADLLLNFYLVSMGYGAEVAGLFSTISRGAGVALGIPIGILIDRAGPRAGLIVGTSGFALGWVLLISSNSLWMLMAGQFLAGASMILAQTAVVPLLTIATTDEQRATIFGWNASAAMIIGLLGSAIAGVLPSVAATVLGTDAQATMAYRVALVLVVVIAWIAILPVLRPITALSQQDKAVTDHDQPRLRMPLIDLIRWALPSVFLGVAGGLFLPFQNLFFREQFQLPDSTVGLILAGAALAMGIGGLIGGPISRVLGLRNGAAWGRLILVPASLLILSPVLPIAILGFFLRGMFVAASFPLTDALVMQSVPAHQRGVAMSLLATLWALGWAIAAVVSGLIQRDYGFTPVLVAAAIAYAISAWLIWATASIRPVGHA